MVAFKQKYLYTKFLLIQLSNIIGPCGSIKTNALLNSIQKQNSDSPIDKIYLHAKDLVK